MVIQMKVLIACNVQISSVPSTNLSPVKGLVNSSGKPILAYKVRNGIGNHLVVVKSNGKILDKEAIEEFIRASGISYTNFKISWKNKGLEIAETIYQRKYTNSFLDFLVILEEFLR